MSGIDVQHDAPVKTVNWIKGTSYNCLMTGSWDKTLKVCDLLSPVFHKKANWTMRRALSGA